MSQRTQPDGAGSKNVFGKIRYRNLAILIMLIGAAGFVVALLLFDKQVLCLFGSTVVTIAGLGVNIAARRMGLDPVDETPVRRTEHSGGAVSGRHVPPALRGRARRKEFAQQEAPAPQEVAEQEVPTPQEVSPQEVAAASEVPAEAEQEFAVEQEIPTPQEVSPQEVSPQEVSVASEAFSEVQQEVLDGTSEAPDGAPDEAATDIQQETTGLVERVIAVLKSQGARVRVISERDDRCILAAAIGGSHRATLLVLEGSQPVGVADARALLSMTTRTAGGTGWLVARAVFPSEVYAWATSRVQIRLLNENALNELEI